MRIFCLEKKRCLLLFVDRLLFWAGQLGVRVIVEVTRIIC